MNSLTLNTLFKVFTSNLRNSNFCLRSPKTLILCLLESSPHYLQLFLFDKVQPRSPRPPFIRYKFIESVANTQANPLIKISHRPHLPHLFFSPPSFPSSNNKEFSLFFSSSFLPPFHGGNHLLVCLVCKIRSYQAILRHLLHNIQNFRKDP